MNIVFYLTAENIVIYVFFEYFLKSCWLVLNLVDLNL